MECGDRQKSPSRDEVGCVDRRALTGMGWDVETERRVLAGMKRELSHVRVLTGMGWDLVTEES